MESGSKLTCKYGYGYIVVPTGYRTFFVSILFGGLRLVDRRGRLGAKLGDVYLEDLRL